MQEQRINYQYVPGLIKGTRHRPNERFGKVHRGDAFGAKRELEEIGLREHKASDHEVQVSKKSSML